MYQVSEEETREDGSGGFGFIFFLACQQSDKGDMALKLMHRVRGMTQQTFESEVAALQLYEQACFPRRPDEADRVGIASDSKSSNGSGRETWTTDYILMPKGQGQDLAKVVVDASKRAGFAEAFDESQKNKKAQGQAKELEDVLLNVLSSVTTQLKCLHDLGIRHNDLKLPNIMAHVDVAAGGVTRVTEVTIIDFGLACSVNDVYPRIKQCEPNLLAGTEYHYKVRDEGREWTSYGTRGGDLWALAQTLQSTGLFKVQSSKISEHPYKLALGKPYTPECTHPRTKKFMYVTTNIWQCVF